jgi:hypothetical protein
MIIKCQITLTGFPRFPDPGAQFLSLVLPFQRFEASEKELCAKIPEPTAVRSLHYGPEF